MSYEVFILDDAENDINEAFLWYESRQLGLGIEFISELDNAISILIESPKWA